MLRHCKPEINLIRMYSKALTSYKAEQSNIMVHVKWLCAVKNVQNKERKKLIMAGAGNGTLTHLRDICQAP